MTALAALPTRTVASRRELLARRNQLEVALAALERRHPGMAGIGPPDDPVLERARRQWERLRQSLDAVEADLLRFGPDP